MLDHGGQRETVRRWVARTFQRRLALAIVALDHQRTGFIDEVEITDGCRARRQFEFEASTGPVAAHRIKRQHAQEIALVLAILGQQRLFQHGPKQAGAGLQGHAFIPARAWYSPILAQHRCGRNAGCVRAFKLLAVHHRRVNALDAPIQTRFDQIGAELIADPDTVADALDAFQIEIGARQIAAVSGIPRQAERHFEIGVMQKNRFLDINAARLKIGNHAAEKQHRVGAVGLGAKAIIRQHIN